MIGAVPGTRAEVAEHLDATGRAELKTALVGSLVKRIAALPGLARVDVYPDVTQKAWGFPAGITTVAAGPDPMVYPMAVPDIACGFLVIATGIASAAWPVRQRRAFLQAVAEAIGVGSSRRSRPRMDLDAVFTHGADALPRPCEYAVDEHTAELAEHTTTCPPRPELVTPAAREAVADQMGSVAGHFVSCYAADPLTPGSPAASGEVVLIVHTGAPALRDTLMTSHVLPIAEQCIQHELLPLDLIGQGLFGLPLSHRISHEFLALSACAVHWGYANRQIVAGRLLQLLAVHAPRAQHGRPRLIRHVSHCAYRLRQTPGGAEIATARGIQPLTARRDRQRVPAPSTFITGGSHTHAYLVRPAPHAEDHGGVCPHGTPQWEPAHTPAAIASSPLTDPRSAHVVIANTTPGTGYQRRHLINTETTIAALRELGIAMPVTRLRPLVNYRERRYD